MVSLPTGAGHGGGIRGRRGGTAGGGGEGGVRALIGVAAQPGSGTMPWRSSQARASASTFLPAIVTCQLRKTSSRVRAGPPQRQHQHPASALRRNREGRLTDRSNVKTRAKVY
jgi:hypothetical protein